MRNRLLFFLLLASNISFAQIVGVNCYLQGAYLEIGMCTNAAFGAAAPPAGYHPHLPGAGPIAEVYDYGHDGWTVGTPPYMGDYSYPGSPFEGWEVQMNGMRSQQYASPAYSFAPYSYSGAATMTATSWVSYSNTGGVARGLWTGTFNAGGASLLIRQETRVDTTASAVVVTTTFKNISGTAANNVYYWRSTDPDNDQTWGAYGGMFPTDNYVDWQVTTPGNPKHKVSVTGIGRSTPRPPFTLCTKDNRAVALVYSSWGLGVGTDLATVWSKTYGAGAGGYNVGPNYAGDIGIGIVWNLCNILPGDSTAISYAYVFNGATGIDDPGALPDPVLSIAGTPVSGGGHGHDTVDGCSMPGVDSVLIEIPYGADKSWITGRWKWTPATGLSATTGTKVYVRMTAIPGYVTYTVTGTTDTGSCLPSLTDTFIFTVRSCHLAWATDPCVGGALHIGMAGDSIGATYKWVGPTGFTSTLHSPWIFPTSWADSGMYRVIRTIGGIDDTDFVRVVLHPLPVINATSNIPNACDPFQNPLNLFASLDSIGETFLWSGPLGFSSTLQNPVIAPFDSSMQGTYTVTGTTIWGCQSTTTTDVLHGISAYFGYEIHYGCEWDTVYLTNGSYNANKYLWFFNDGTPDDTTRHAMHVFKAKNDTVRVSLYLNNGRCAANTYRVLDLRHEIYARYDATPDTICFNGGANSITFDTVGTGAIDSGRYYAASGFGWRFGDGTFDNTQTNPVTHTFTTPGIFPVTLLVNDAMGCPDSITHNITVVDIKVKSFHDTLLCVSQPLPLTNVIESTPMADWNYKFSWSQSPVTNLDNDTVQIPNLFGVGVFTDVLTVTIPGIVPDACPVTNTMVINSVLGKKLQNLTVTQTIDYGSSIQLNASNEVIYYWLPNDGSLDNNNINNPIASPKRTTTYTVFGLDDNGCRDSAYITVYVDTTMDQDVPTAFSPNGDGINDVFKPVGIKFQHMVEFRVFNRWGQEIFYTNNKEVGWDGTFHGTKQDLGVYNYLIIVNKPGQDNIVYKGNVTLVR